eukprot:COSAG01_NODE_23610_length_808_cov_6.418964_1_plen_194_part_10
MPRLAAQQPTPPWPLHLAAAVAPSIFCDKNRRRIGKSQSKRQAAGRSGRRTVAHPQRRREVPLHRAVLHDLLGHGHGRRDPPQPEQQKTAADEGRLLSVTARVAGCRLSGATVSLTRAAAVAAAATPALSQARQLSGQLSGQLSCRSTSPRRRVHRRHPREATRPPPPSQRHPASPHRPATPTPRPAAAPSCVS